MKKSRIKFLGAIAILVFSTNTFGQTDDDLTKACKSGDLNAVKKAVEAGSNVNALRSDGAPIMVEAMFWPEIMQYLIDKGADPNGGTYSALTLSANHYSYEVMEILLKNGADVNKGKTMSKLHPIASLIATEKAKPKPDKKVIKVWQEQLAEAGGTMDPIKYEVTPLENTINQTHCIKCIEVLLKNKADAKTTDVVGNDMITNAVLRTDGATQLTNFQAYGKMLSENYGYKVPSWFTDGSRNGKTVDKVKALVDGGADVNYLNKVNETTPLIAALGGKNIEASKYLINNGADVSIITPNKKTALSTAAKFADVELVKLIVEKGADINAESWEYDEALNQYAKGFTALTMAVISNNVPVAEYLIKAGCKASKGVHGYYFNYITKCPFRLTNKNSIFFAIDHGNLEMVKMLVESFKSWSNEKMVLSQPEVHGPYDRNRCDKNKGSYTPRTYASQLEQKEIVTYLKSVGIK